MPTPIYFISGLPRSGSTLMVNLLGQNPMHHVGPTSGLIHLVRTVQGKWTKCQEFQAQGLEAAKPFVHSSMRGLMTGFYEQQLADEKIIFDKSRGWVQYIELVEKILGQEIRIISMVRDVRDIAASWEKLYRKRDIEYKEPDPEKTNAMDSVAGRVKRLLAPKNVTGRSIRRLRDAMNRCGDRLIIVPYNHFTEKPVETMDAIHKALGLNPFDYNPNHVEQITHEDDNYLGNDLHTIRSKIEPQPPEPWRGVIPDAIADKIAKTYADFTSLAAGEVLDGYKK